jgi:hypothetical protein
MEGVDSRGVIYVLRGCWKTGLGFTLASGGWADCWIWGRTKNHAYWCVFVEFLDLRQEIKEKKGFAQKRLRHFLGKVHGRRMKEPMIFIP